jgi:hypothetical protein
VVGYQRGFLVLEGFVLLLGALGFVAVLGLE